MLHTLILIGRSGCGKGTQATLLKDRINRLDEKGRQILYVETGDHFRKFIRGESYSSKLSNKIYISGEREPDFLGTWMWSDLLIEELGEDMHLLFDGAPRARPEAEILTTALKFYKREKPTVIHIKVSRRWSEEKLLTRGRSDDVTPVNIEKRLDWFDSDVVPAINYLKNDSYYRFVEIDGEQSIEKVHADIVANYDHQA